MFTNYTVFKFFMKTPNTMFEKPAHFYGFLDKNLYTPDIDEIFLADFGITNLFCSCCVNLNTPMLSVYRKSSFLIRTERSGFCLTMQSMTYG